MLHRDLDTLDVDVPALLEKLVKITEENADLKKKHHDALVAADDAQREHEEELRAAAENVKRLQTLLDRQSAALKQEVTKGRILAESLAKQSSAVAAMQRQQQSAEAAAAAASARGVLKARHLQARVASAPREREGAGSPLERMSTELTRARWELDAAKAKESELRAALFREEATHQAAHEQHHHQQHRLHLQRDAQIEEAVMRIAEAEQLAQARLEEAANVRVERSMLEARVGELERSLRIAGQRAKLLNPAANLPPGALGVLVPPRSSPYSHMWAEPPAPAPPPAPTLVVGQLQDSLAELTNAPMGTLAKAGKLSHLRGGGGGGRGQQQRGQLGAMQRVRQGAPPAMRPSSPPVHVVVPSHYNEPPTRPNTPGTPSGLGRSKSTGGLSASLSRAPGSWSLSHFENIP